MFWKTAVKKKSPTRRGKSLSVVYISTLTQSKTNYEIRKWIKAIVLEFKLREHVGKSILSETPLILQQKNTKAGNDYELPKAPKLTSTPHTGSRRVFNASVFTDHVSKMERNGSACPGQRFVIQGCTDPESNVVPSTNIWRCSARNLLQAQHF